MAAGRGQAAALAVLGLLPLVSRGAARRRRRSRFRTNSRPCLTRPRHPRRTRSTWSWTVISASWWWCCSDRVDEDEVKWLHLVLVKRSSW